MISRSLVVLILFSPSVLWAQERVLGGGEELTEQGVSQPLVLILVLMGLVLLPIIAMMTTSFVKLSVVLSMLRNALGTQQIPPTPIITGLALIMTIYIMTPVGTEMYRAAEATIQQGTNQPILSQVSVDLVLKGVKEAKEPVRKFLMKHAHKAEQKLFYTMAKKTQNPDIKVDDFMVLIPAFVISELTEAFQIAFIIFLPFLVIDIVITNILLALGMFMVPPTTIALPFKLLLFVIVDGWHILSRSLLMGYM